MKDIANFAANLISEQVSGKKKSFEAPILKGEGPDLRNVKVSSNSVNLILEQSFGIKQSKLEKPKEEVLTEETKIKEVEKPIKTPNDLLVEFQELILKARGLIQEMTSCGLLGISQVSKKKTKKKWKYRKVE